MSCHYKCQLEADNKVNKLFGFGVAASNNLWWLTITIHLCNRSCKELKSPWDGQYLPRSCRTGQYECEFGRVARIYLKFEWQVWQTLLLLVHLSSLEWLSALSGQKTIVNWTRPKTVNYNRWHHRNSALVNNNSSLHVGSVAFYGVID